MSARNKPSIKKTSKRKAIEELTSGGTVGKRTRKTVGERKARKVNVGEISRESDSPKQLSVKKAIKKDTLDLQPCLRGKKISHYMFAGIAVTDDGRILFSDWWNQRVSVFSKEPALKFLSFVRVPQSPRGIAVLNDSEVAVCTDKKRLILLDITGPKLKIKDRIRLSFEICGVTRHRDKLVIIGSAIPASSGASVGTTVKLIDRSGTSYWSVDHDQQGPQKWLTPESVCSYVNGLSSFVVVSECHRKTLTLINGETGKVIKRRHLMKEPFGVTADSAGNVFVCYLNNHEISVFSSDLSKETVILSAKDGLSERPRIIAADNASKQLFVAFWSSPICECFEVL